MLYGVATDYARNAGRKRDYIQVWSGSFMSDWEANGVSLPNNDGYMLKLFGGGKLRVSCPAPRNEQNYQEVDEAINVAMNASR